METQRHEKEGQALLAVRAACLYCTFIQIAHGNCYLDVDFGLSCFFLCFLFFFFFFGFLLLKKAMKRTFL